MKIEVLVGVCAVSLGLMGCTEKAQTIGQRKGDARAFQGPGSGYTAPGWKVGDAESWEQQIKKRGQGQNENSRIGPR